MMPYILYAALILTACLIFYKLLLQKETFFHLNRFVLLSCMLLAFVLPLVKVPPQWSFRDPPVFAADTATETAIHQSVDTRIQATINAPVGEKVPVSSTISAERVLQWLVYLYWFGVAVFAGNFLLQACLLLYKAYSRPVIQDGKYRIVEVAGDEAPCSFGNNIFINPSKYDWPTYNQVLLHEKIHIEQRHSIDLLLAELALIFQWFNPFAWAWRKELESNLEFFTDQQLLAQPEVEKENYQLSLLKVAAPHFPLSLTTNYNQSLLKKRILMMNAKRSSLHTAWKYFFLLPLLVLFVCLFNEPIATAQHVVTKAKPASRSGNNSDIKTSGNWFATIKGDEVSIQFKGSDDNNSSNSTTFKLSEFKDLPRDKAGIFTLVREAGTMEFKGKFEGDKGMGEYRFIADKSYSGDMQKEGIDVSKEQDDMVFFLINVQRSYVKMLRQQGYSKLDREKVIPLAALDINEAYITSIKQAGFPDISLDNLVPFKALNVDKKYIEEIHQAGYKNVTPDKIITFKAQGIDGKYIADFRNSAKAKQAKKSKQDKTAGDDKTSDDDKNNSSNASVTDSQPDSNSADKGDEDAMIAFKSMNIDPAFVNSFKEVGYTDLSNDNLIAMKAVGVTPGFIKSLRDAGYTDIKADDLIALKSQNVTPALIKQYKDLGFGNLNLNDVVGAKATGTSPSFIIAMRKKGHNMKTLDKYISLRSVLSE